MSRPARPLRRTVLVVAGIHVALITVVGLPFATCQKPKKIQPVEIVDLGSLRPGPGSPAPPIVSSSPPSSLPPQPKTPAPPEPTPEVTPEPPAETKPETAVQPPIETKPSPQSQPKPDPTPAPKPEPVSQPKPNPPAKHQVKVSAVKKKVTGISPDAQAAPKAPPGPSAADIKSRLASAVPGEVPGSGGDGAGMEGRPDGIADDFSWYRALIKQTVQAKWKKPPILSGEKIITEAAIRIAPDGTVTFLNLSKPSGDAAMDASVEAAVRAATKIPRPLPDGLGTPDYTVIIQFKLE